MSELFQENKKQLQDLKKVTFTKGTLREGYTIYGWSKSNRAIFWYRVYIGSKHWKSSTKQYSATIGGGNTILAMVGDLNGETMTPARNWNSAKSPTAILTKRFKDFQKLLD
jgi:hypothetical protein